MFKCNVLKFLFERFRNIKMIIVIISYIKIMLTGDIFISRYMSLLRFDREAHNTIVIINGLRVYVGNNFHFNICRSESSDNTVCTR